LSIHHNAASSPTVAGTETYYARTRPADREFAEVIHQSLLTVVPGPDREVRPANFVVLRETRMPAALIEIDFLTHPERERQLSDPAFQERVAAAIAEGIRRFWSGFRPLGGTHE